MVNKYQENSLIDGYNSLICNNGFTNHHGNANEHSDIYYF